MHRSTRRCLRFRLSAFFNPKDYYIATRGISFDEFTNADSDLYISATRPEERFFPFFGLHRISSLFIEPVSLGNYVVTVTAFIAAFWRSIGGWTKTFLILSNLLFLIASDGRFAFASSLLVVAAVGLSLPSWKGRDNPDFLPWPPLPEGVRGAGPQPSKETV